MFRDVNSIKQNGVTLIWALPLPDTLAYRMIPCVKQPVAFAGFKY